MCLERKKVPPADADGTLVSGLGKINVSFAAACFIPNASLRQKYGINIVSIIRGERQINIPRGEERLYPFDKIIIVGTDEELDLFQEIIQKQDKEYRDQLAQSLIIISK